MDAELPPGEIEPAAVVSDVAPPPLLEPAPAPPPVFVPPLLPRLLAGLESGVLGAAVMMAWFALDSVLERQYWWAMLNLWGAGVYHNRVFSMGLGIATIAGASMHFFLHGVGGVLWAVAGARMSNYWLHLAGSFVAAAVWYSVLMHAFWPAVAPVVSRISPRFPTLLAYFLFGAALSRNARRARQLSSIGET